MASRAAAAVATRSVFRSASSSSVAAAASRARCSKPTASSFGIPKRGASIAQAPRLLRSPIEMSSFCLESLMPMHSVTSAAVMTSLLAVSRTGYGWLAEAGKDDV